LEFLIEEAETAVWLQPQWGSRELPPGERHRPSEGLL
jgi:hypothetical protein